jgi:tetratricopeptide (TPR) repeat protein
MKTKAIFLLGLVVSLGALAQPNWEWGQDPDKAKEKNALYTDAMKSGNNTEAATHLQWLLENTPNLNVSIYINGAKIFEQLANDATDATQKKEYTDKCLSMFDLRIKYFNDEADVLNRKAFVAYSLLKRDKTRYKELLDLFDRGYELNQNRFFPNNLLAYMDVMRLYRAVKLPITNEQILDRYFNIMDVIDSRNDVPEQIVDQIEKLLLMIDGFTLDCETIIKDFGPKLKSNPDLKLAKKIFTMMLNGKCADDPLALIAAKIIFESDPTYAVAKFIAQQAAGNKSYDEAVKFYTRALELTEENVKKAEIQLSMARIKGLHQGLKASARTLAYEALSNDPSLKDAYRLIGDLYMNSFDDCKGLKDIVADRSVFIAAYEMYQKAGDTAAMARAKAQFPSGEEIFNSGYEIGQEYKVNCWINTTVTLDKRPASN